MNIHVKDEEPPRVISCPQSFEDTLSRGQMLKKVRYKDMIFIILIPIVNCLFSVGRSQYSGTMLGSTR